MKASPAWLIYVGVRVLGHTDTSALWGCDRGTSATRQQRREHELEYGHVVAVASTSTRMLVNVRLHGYAVERGDEEVVANSGPSERGLES